eukprot:jgi/Ulvmu1/7918/UM004_0150.1
MAMRLQLRHLSHHRHTAGFQRRLRVMQCSAVWTSTMAKQHLGEGRDWGSVQTFMDSVIAGKSGWEGLRCDMQTEARPSIRKSHGDDAESGSSTLELELPQIQQDYQGRGKRDRRTYKLKLAYSGPAFDGWTYQPDEGHMSTREELRRRLRAIFALHNSLIVESAGRTDQGVYGHGQVASFYSWDVKSPEVIAQAINQPHAPELGNRPQPAYRPDSLRCLDCRVVPRSFHATFACQWRRYLYLLPLSQQDGLLHHQHQLATTNMTPATEEVSSRSSEVEWANIADTVDRTLRSLEGQDLDYYAFGRSTPKGRNCVCNMMHASCKLAYLPRISPAADVGVDNEAHEELCMHTQLGDGGGHVGAQQRVPVLCIQLVGNRFIRRMVRTLVATTVMSAIWNDPMRVPQALQTRERRDTAYPAPATGLCFTGAGYDDQPPDPLCI